MRNLLLTSPTCILICQLVASTDCRQLRSSTVNTCLVARTSTCLGDRSFAAAGPRLWNSLPTHLRQPDLSLGRFRRALKTHLFLAAWLRRLVTICFSAPLYNYPYLLTYLFTTPVNERLNVHCKFKTRTTVIYRQVKVSHFYVTNSPSVTFCWTKVSPRLCIASRGKKQIPLRQSCLTFAWVTFGD